MPTKIITSKDRIGHLYTQFNPENPAVSVKSSYGLPCSDQKLLLYGIQARVFNNNTPKPTGVPSKLKETKKNLLNNTTESITTFSNKRNLNQLPKSFQEKYCELARYTGNELSIPQYPRSSYTPSRLISRSKGNPSETKAEKMKQEILASFTQNDSNGDYPSANRRKDSFSLKKNGIVINI